MFSDICGIIFQFAKTSKNQTFTNTNKISGPLRV